MSELAFSINGEAFDLPATATGWRVSPVRQRGAPEVVYGKDGVPLIVPIEAALEELRQLVGASGRYRLDAIDDRGRTIDKLPASYVHVAPSESDVPAAVESKQSPIDPQGFAGLVGALRDVPPEQLLTLRSNGCA